MNEQQARQCIQETFENPFSKEGFASFIQNLLKHIEDAPFTYQGNYIPEKFRPYIKSLERIGKFSDGENAMDILIITLKKGTSLDRARTMQRNFIAWYLNGSRGGEFKDVALVAYVSPDQTDWRFSLVKMDYKFEKTKTGKMKVKEEFTPARRWSFLMGVNEKSHTAQSQLVKILHDSEPAPTLAKLEEAFNIETVTKEFFRKYRELFIRTKEALDKVVENDPKVKADFDLKGVDTVNFAKKLLGQIIFLYFLQKKGWFGVGRDDEWGTGSKRFLRDLFDKNIISYENYFNDVLEPLFYDALARDKSDIDHWNEHFKSKIPFLNGGLFDPIGNYDWVHTDINLPDTLFSNTRKTREGDIGDGILDVFDRYNFTVREDEPLEKEVAIDPELLGKAYEKFNAIRPDNFEEFIKALKSGKKGEENKFNKKYGVYYTPREIVHYMCQQSLINYLATRAKEARLETPITKQDIKDLIDVGEMIIEHEATALIKEQKIKNGTQKSTEYTALLSDGIRKNAKIIDDWLADITVCDPAVGSGAFPVGMMKEIVRARNVLSVFLKGNTGIPACEGGTGISACEGGTGISACEGGTGISACEGGTGILACDPDPDSVHITRRNLPHWTKAGAIYWITFRLADSLPQEKLNVWKAEQKHWTSRHQEPWSDEEWQEYSERFGERLEKWLDAGYGSCVLSKPELRNIVKDCLLRFDGERLHVHAVVIMPNHVHLLIEPFAGNMISELLKGIKGASARKINQLLGKTGTKFWMDESYDHIVRSERQYYHFIEYILNNPAKAKLSQDKYWLYQCTTGIPACEGDTGISACEGGTGISACEGGTGISAGEGGTDISACEGSTDKNVSEGTTGISACEGFTDKNVCVTLRSSYEFKRHCIEHSLYGVDIDPGAVEIAKLRLWLSLVVDEEDIKNIKPLPNLDYKIVRGDSLIGFPENWQSPAFARIETLKKQFFAETDHNKKAALKAQINIEIQKQLASSKQVFGHQVDFDFRLMFSEVWHHRAGFDVVIGNPPYVQIQNFSGQQVQKDWKAQKYESFAKTGDIYCLFYEKGYRLLKDQGALAFITSNKWMRAAYGEKLRRFFAEKTQPLTLINFSSFQVFETATVDTNVLLFEKSKRCRPVRACLISPAFTRSTPLDLFVKKNSIELDELSSDSWVISDKRHHHIKKRIEQVGTPLKQWDIAIYRGILTGFNEAFIIDGQKKDELVATEPKTAKLIKPFLSGRDLKRYKVNFHDAWLLFIPWHFPLHKDDNIKGASTRAEKEFENNYPALYEYFLNHKEPLSKRNKAETGIRYEWYALQRCAATYYEEFSKDKIVWGNLALSAQFSKAEPKFFINAPGNLISGENLSYLLAILNSEVGDFYIRSLGVTRNGGYFEYKPMFVENLPVPKPDEPKRKPFERLADYVLLSTKHDQKLQSAYFEQLIDALVYELYFPDELKAAGKEILRHLGELTPITDAQSSEEKLAIIKQQFDRLYDPRHPARKIIETLDSVEVVRTIREALKR